MMMTSATTTTGSMMMTEEELAKHDSKTLLQLLLSADARCDALTAEREALEQDNHRWKMECENFWRDREKDLTAERDRLRAALGAFVAHYPKGINPDLDAACFAARAALKGETP